MRVHLLSDDNFDHQGERTLIPEGVAQLGLGLALSG